MFPKILNVIVKLLGKYIHLPWDPVSKVAIHGPSKFFRLFIQPGHPNAVDQ